MPDYFLSRRTTIITKENIDISIIKKLKMLAQLHIVLWMQFQAFYACGLNLI